MGEKTGQNRVLVMFKGYLAIFNFWHLGSQQNFWAPTPQSGREKYSIHFWVAVYIYRYIYLTGQKNAYFGLIRRLNG